MMAEPDTALDSWVHLIEWHGWKFELSDPLADPPQAIKDKQEPPTDTVEDPIYQLELFTYPSKHPTDPLEHYRQTLVY